MANIKSQIKRNKTNEKARERNKAVRTALKTSTKKVHTAENAEFTAELLKPAASQTWVLVTSAYHMPRAAGLFRTGDRAARRSR